MSQEEEAQEPQGGGGGGIWEQFLNAFSWILPFSSPSSSSVSSSEEEVEVEENMTTTINEGNLFTLPFACGLCLQGIEGDEKLEFARCRHLFHVECMKLHKKCPVCKKNFDSSGLSSRIQAYPELDIVDKDDVSLASTIIAPPTPTETSRPQTRSMTRGLFGSKKIDLSSTTSTPKGPGPGGDAPAPSPEVSLERKCITKHTCTHRQCKERGNVRQALVDTFNNLVDECKKQEEVIQKSQTVLWRQEKLIQANIKKMETQQKQIRSYLKRGVNGQGSNNTKNS